MKRRISASIDEDVFTAAEAAVREGHAPSMSALLEEALRRQIEHTTRLDALREYVADGEAEFGAFAPGELDEIKRRMHADAIIVRPKSALAPRRAA